MVFSSLVFLFVFLPLFLFCYFIFKKRNIRNIVLLLFSLLFYAYGEPIYIVLMLFSIVVNYYLTILIDKKKSKILFVLSIFFNLGLLGIFKYTNFFMGSITNLFNLNSHFLNITLPIGISFYTFQVLTYVIDVYRKKVPVQKNIILLGCYISAFPQLIAGPIVRYSTVNEELQKRRETREDFAAGLRRFILGLAKKVIIANEMAFIADTLFAFSFAETGFIGALIAAISYTLQIYFDFSGYSDMAIGLGRMLGFHYMENFNYPYIAKSITDFWRRWHISLSSFFKDYVYIPLGGNKVGKIRHVINILIVWALTGLWHGASWNFVIWGLYYGILLIIEKYFLKKLLDKMPSFITHIYTMFFVILGWVIFYCTDYNLLLDSFKALFGGYGLGSINTIFYLQVMTTKGIITLLLGILFATPIYASISKLEQKWPFIWDVLLITIFIISVWIILASSYNPFIYYRF